MRTRSILRIGLALSASIYSVSSVSVAVGKRNRGVFRDNSELPESSNNGSSEDHENHPRSLGVGLDNLKYGTAKVQHHKDSKSKGKGEERYSVNESSEGVAKGAGKGYGSSKDTEHRSKSSGLSTKSTKPKNQKKEYKSAKGPNQSKLTKSEKGSPTPRPNFQPTSQPTNKQNPPNGDDITGLLSPYTILYTVTDDERPPFRSELLEVVELTRTYLDTYFISNYKQSELSNLSKVMTLFTSTAFDFGEAIPIDYESKAVFEASSILIPDKEDLDNILASAFQGDNLDGYIGLLQSLPPSNLFSSTQYAQLIQTNQESSGLKYEGASQDSLTRNLTLGSIFAGGVAGLVLIFVTTRRIQRKMERRAFANKSSTSLTGESFTTNSSQLGDRMCRPICDELYFDNDENRR